MKTNTMNKSRFVQIGLIGTIALLVFGSFDVSADPARMVQSFDQCDIDIRPAAVSRNLARNLHVDYLATKDGVDLGLTMTWDEQAFDLLSSDGSLVATLPNAKRTVIALHWKEVAKSEMVTISNGTASADLASTGTHDATERDVSPSFERETPSTEFVRIRCRYRGRTTFFIVKPHVI